MEPKHISHHKYKKRSARKSAERFL